MKKSGATEAAEPPVRLFMKKLSFVFLLALSACSTMPVPQGSAFVKVVIAGQSWTKGRLASAVYMAEIKAPEKLPFFVEISLPNPDGNSPEVIRKEIQKGETVIKAEGKPRAGWANATVYDYGLKIFTDSGYTKPIDSVVQTSRCMRPPDSALDRLQ